jgi:hypothetical protein
MKGMKDLEEKMGGDTDQLERKVRQLMEVVQLDQGSTAGRAVRRASTRGARKRTKKKMDRAEIVQELDALKAILATKRKDRACHAMLIAVKRSGSPMSRDQWLH